MIRLASLVLFIVAVLLIAGCGEKEPSKPQSKISTNSQTSEQLLEIYRSGDKPSQAEVVALARKNNPRAFVKQVRKDVIVVCDSAKSGNCLLTLTPDGPIAVTAGGSYQQASKVFAEQIKSLRKMKKEQDVVESGPKK